VPATTKPSLAQRRRRRRQNVGGLGPQISAVRVLLSPLGDCGLGTPQVT
jgi:hypothetical protein